MFLLVMFEKADSLDVVPRGCLMAKEALVDSRVLLLRDHHGYHFEVHHVMAGRSLVALGAGLRDGRRMAEFRDRPLRRGVALRAVVAKEAGVTVFGLMARCAVEQRFRALQVRGER